MSKLTAAQKKWLKGVQAALSAPGGEGLGFYTIGDPQINVFALADEEQINALLDSGQAFDFCVAVNELEACLGALNFPHGVYSTAG